ncbi:Fic family protein [Neolewinella agarilytica]|uniref:Fic family protein n=1 Tax=Neolewinella agarilytica TaxID=478744 RepID=A0A1H9J7D0_9BACT|nr:Fic family protein [Neolewinella agarilytica]SEQ82760.1 Fic family protein [Neolewinella agarilytica]
MAYKPPYTISSSMLEAVGQINLLIGQIQGYQLLTGNLKLRRQNKIKTVMSSLAIEGNTLSEDQISDIIDGKIVMGPPKEILEVKNALAVYDVITELDPESEDDLLRSHGILMKGLIDDAGKYRRRGVGVIDGQKVIHIGPPFNRVPHLMGDIFDYLANYPEETIIKSCVFHYEFEFIHPFADGNGRMGRLWQTVILMAKYSILQFVPFETIVYQRQQEYYQALADSQSLGNSDPFIHFMLDALRTALEYEASRMNVRQNFESRLLAFREQLRQKEFGRKDYQLFHKTLSTATASRDLKRGVTENILVKNGEQRNTVYRFI